MSKSILEIVYPEQLKSRARLNGTSDISIGNFGHVPYGKSIEGRVVSLQENRDGCNSFGDSLKKYNDQNLIVMVVRGNCKFVKKVKNIEKAGGKLAIIVDNKYHEDGAEITMSSDGTQLAIKIPAILVNMQKGNSIIQYLQRYRSGDAEIVKFKMSFGFAQTSDHVEYNFMFDPSRDKALDFISSFKEYHQSFGTSVTFTPRFHTWSCDDCEGSILEDDCIINGKYCNVNQNNLAFRGKEIIFEILRERCIREGPNGDKKWWKYMKKAHSLCDSTLVYDCSQSVQQILDIDWKKVDDCVNDSFKSDYVKNTTDNLILNEEQEYINSQKSHSGYTSLYINGDIYNGDLDSDYVKEAICSAFINKPATCQRFLASQIVDQANFEHKSEYDTQQMKIPTNEESLFWPLILGFLLLIAVFCILFKTKIFKKSKVIKEERIEVEELDISNHPCL